MGRLDGPDPLQIEPVIEGLIASIPCSPALLALSAVLA